MTQAELKESPAAQNAAANVPGAVALIDAMARRAKLAAAKLATAPTRKKNAALLGMAASFRANAPRIREENEKDLAAAAAAELSPAIIDRLRLSDKGIEAMAAALEQVARLEDPVGEIVGMKLLPNGIQLGQMRVPIGVIGIIFESRPNVTADAGCLCLKSGNAVILRGGSEAFHSNMVLAELMDDAIQQAGLPQGCVQLIPTTDRAAVDALLVRNDLIDLIIPRGGKSLIEKVVATSRIPVIKHYDGNCFVYIDASAEALTAMSIVLNAKTQRPGVCNAAESLLIHRDWAAKYGRDLIDKLREHGVDVVAGERLRTMIPDLAPATMEDWETEYLDLKITAGIVDGVEEAIDFINAHGSHHTDAIVTSDYNNSMRFVAAVDSACVFVNCSTRFSDGGQFGMGCEIGISTDKLHARGPMGLKELTTLKFIAFGKGQVRE